VNGTVCKTKEYSKDSDTVRLRVRSKGVHTIEMTFEMCEKLGLPIYKRHGRIEIEGFGELRLV